jgi:hypothetical protein
MKTLTPAYGRDYRSKKAAIDDFEANKDFILNDITDQYDGKPCNKSDLIKAGIKQVMIRYKKLTMITPVQVS